MRGCPARFHQQRAGSFCRSPCSLQRALSALLFTSERALHPFSSPVQDVTSGDVSLGICLPLSQPQGQGPECRKHKALMQESES